MRSRVSATQVYEAQAAQDKLDAAAANVAAKAEKAEKARHSPSFARQLTWTHPPPSRALY